MKILSHPRWPDLKNRSVAADFEFCPWEMKRILLFTFFFSLSKPLRFLNGGPIGEFLAYSYTSWPSWLHPWNCFCSALSWYFDRRLTLPPITGKVRIVIINSWSLDVSGCMLQISHYTGACDGAETADPNALSLCLALLPPIMSIRKVC